ncbi:MAG: hypothetical protein R6V40_03505 [Candidatus Moraniibacteriota bacterium]
MENVAEESSTSLISGFLNDLVLTAKYFQKLYFQKDDYNFISDEECAGFAPVGEKKVICHCAGKKHMEKTCRKFLIYKATFEGLEANSMKIVDQENVGNKKAITIIQPYRIRKN